MKLDLNADVPLLVSCCGFSFALDTWIIFSWWVPTFPCWWLFSSSLGFWCFHKRWRQVLLLHDFCCLGYITSLNFPIRGARSCQLQIGTCHGCYLYGFPGGSEDKASACNAGDPGSIPGLGRFPGEGNGNPLQYSCLENPMVRGAWRATVHGVTKSQTRLSNFTMGATSTRIKSRAAAAAELYTPWRS